MSKATDLTGQRFGRLMVVARAEHYQQGNTRWECICECGNKKTVRGAELRRGHVKSCGCLRQEVAKKHMTDLHSSWGSDGWSRRRLYQVWAGMKYRCNNPNRKNYSNYGGRGIKVCDEWITDYRTFERWALDNGWQEGRSLDRIDNDGPYAPWNCRWATPKEQCSNQRTNVILEFQGKQQTLSQWAEELGVSRSTLNNRYRAGWSTERILTTPVRNKDKLVIR